MKELIVVSGLPRSGTSMMMAALHAGGISLLTDELRPPDVSNPQGYFEYQPIRRLAEDSSWLEKHRGQAVKIIYRLLYHIPSDLPTRVIFMERDMAQVLHSQSLMLGGKEDGRDWGKIYRGELQRVQTFMEKHPRMQILRIDYEDFLQGPLELSHQIAAFLDLALDVNAMAAVVDPTLHRQRG